MNDNDMELKVLKGDPIDIGIGKVHPLKLSEITEIGGQKYNHILSLITYKSPEDVVIDGHKLEPLEIVTVYCFQDNNFKELLLYGLSKIFKESIHLHENGFFYLGEIEEQRILDNATFNQVVLIIKKQNFLKDAEEEKEYKPLNDKARELQEKLKEVKQKLKQQNNDEGLNISDIISIISAYMPSVSIFSVWDLTVYQMYVLYLRLLLRDNYESNLYLLPHMSDSKSLDLKHWATKIKQ